MHVLVASDLAKRLAQHHLNPKLLKGHWSICLARDSLILIIRNLIYKVALSRWHGCVSLYSYEATQIAKFMGPTWGPSGSCRPQMAPCWPHEPCYQGSIPGHWLNLCNWSDSIFKITPILSHICTVLFVVPIGVTSLKYHTRKVTHYMYLCLLQ